MGREAVFVSYAQADRAIALAIVGRLEAERIQCWIAPRDVTPGVDWAAAIIEAIAAARVMVLVFSASANTSPQVRREIERAVHRQVPVLPFRVEDVLPSSSLEYFLSSQHWLDAFSPPMAPHYTRLYTHLKGILEAEAAQPLLTDAPVAPQPAAQSEAVSIDAATLQRLETELATYIGPVARHLVGRAALRSPGVEALVSDLAAEIESEAERREFLAAARQSLRGRP
jgi:hypothetical protein